MKFIYSNLLFRVYFINDCSSSTGDLKKLMKGSMEIMISVVTLLTLANIANAQSTIGEEAGIAVRDCVSQLSNLALVKTDCKNFSLAVNELLKQGFDLKLYVDGSLYLAK